MGKQRNKIAQQIHDASAHLTKIAKETFANPIEFGTGIEVPYEEWEKDLKPALKKVTKLNEELTVENSRLIEQCDFFKTNCDYWMKSSKEFEKNLTWETHLLNQEKIFHKETKRDLNSALQVGAEYLTELQQIKSTRLYKFFKWLGVW